MHPVELGERSAGVGRTRRIAAGALVSLALASALGAQQFSSPDPIWDHVPISCAGGPGAFGKSAVLRMSGETIADVVVQRGTRLYLSLEPGTSKECLGVPTSGDVRDFAVMTGGGYPDALVTAESGGVWARRYTGTAFQQELLPITASVERVAIGPMPTSPEYRTLVLWSPSPSRILVYAIRWNPPSTETIPILTFDPGPAVTGLALARFDGDPYLDIAVTNASGLKIYTLWGSALYSVTSPGTTVALVPFCPQAGATGGDATALAWLWSAAGVNYLQAVHAPAADPALVLNGAWAGSYAGLTVFAGSTAEPGRLALSRFDGLASGAVGLIKFQASAPLLTFESALPVAASNPSTGWAQVGDADHDMCEERVDLLTFDDSSVACDLHRGTLSTPHAGVSLVSHTSWDLVYANGPENPADLVLNLAIDPLPIANDVTVRVWTWPDFDVFGHGELVGEAQVAGSTQHLQLANAIVDLRPHDPLPDGLLLEIRRRDLQGSPAKTVGVTDLCMKSTVLDFPSWFPPPACTNKVQTGPDSRGVFILPSKPPHNP